MRVGAAQGRCSALTRLRRRASRPCLVPSLHRSHQIMHLCTTFGAAALYGALREDYVCYAAATAGGGGA